MVLTVAVGNALRSGRKYCAMRCSKNHPIPARTAVCARSANDSSSTASITAIEELDKRLKERPDLLDLGVYVVVGEARFERDFQAARHGYGIGLLQALVIVRAREEKQPDASIGGRWARRGGRRHLRRVSSSPKLRKARAPYESGERGETLSYQTFTTVTSVGPRGR